MICRRGRGCAVAFGALFTFLGPWAAAVGDSQEPGLLRASGGPPTAERRSLAEADAAIRGSRTAGDRLQLAVALSQASIVYETLRRFDDAIAASTEALELFAESGDKAASAQTKENLSIFYRKKGLVDEYFTASTDAAKAYQERGDTAAAARVLALRAAVHREFEQYKRAQQILNRTPSTPDVAKGTTGLVRSVSQSIEDASKVLGGIVWNVWFEALDAPYVPVAVLKPDAPYRVVVDFSALNYRHSDKSGVTDTALRIALERGWPAVRKGSPKRLIVMTADDTAITPGRLDYPLVTFSRSAPSALDAARKTVGMSLGLKEQAGGKQEVPCTSASPTGDDLPAFVLGRTCFDVRTGATPGRTALTLVVWAVDQPIDHVSVPVCVSNSTAEICAPFDDASPIFSVVVLSPFQGAGKGAPGFIRQLLSFFGLSSERTPGAFLQLYGFPDERAMGIFWHAAMTKDTPTPFTLTRDLASLRKYLNETTLKAWEASITPARRLGSGRSVYDAILPPQTSTEAREAFLAYAKRITAAPGPSDELQRTLFVQTTNPVFADPFFLPLGLMVPPLQSESHLGQWVNIVTPLPVSRPEPGGGTGCVSRWILVIPPESGDGDTQLRIAVGRFLDLRNNWKEHQNNKDLFVVTLDEFADLMNGSDKNVNLSDARPTGILVLSHQDTNVLRFAPNTVLTPEDLRIPRVFRGPAFAVLNGCSTGGPGSVAFVRRLNEAGVKSIIATSTGVGVEMAGDFMTCFDKALAEPSADGVSARQAYVRTRECLWATYGAQALQYSLLGDGDIKLCPITSTP